MNPIRLMIIAGVTVLGGCVASPHSALPTEARNITATAVSSPSVTVRDPALRMRNGRLELTGFVVKVYAAKTTEQTHLDVSFIDGSGGTLRAETVKFSPQRLINARRAPNRQGNYVVPLDSLPAGTVRIEVRAHDGEHRS